MATSAYFAHFQTSNGFNPDPTASFEDEFNRLCLHMSWDNRTRRRNRSLALGHEVHAYYGTANKLGGWQDLCRDVGIEEIPQSITQCKKELAKVYVNIQDLIDARRTGNVPPRRFPTLGALKRYSFTEHKCFSRTTAKEDGFVKALLRRFVS